MLKQNQLQQPQYYPDFTSSPTNNPPGTDNIMAVTDAAVNSFKKVISLLGRTTRTGHARFRRAPVSPASANQEQQQQAQDLGASVRPISSHPTEPVSAFRVYQPTPVHRLPPLPNSHHQQQKTPSLVAKNGFSERNEMRSINFSNSPSISASTSFMSSLTGETDSVKRSMSSGFQFAEPSHVSSAGKPPLSSSSLKRKCNSMDDAALKCGSTSGRCHCSKKRSVV